MSNSETLVVKTSFKTRDQYAVFEHINGGLAIQIASFIMLSMPMYTHYETLNWNSCTALHERFLSPDAETCKD